MFVLNKPLFLVRMIHKPNPKFNTLYKASISAAAVFFLSFATSGCLLLNKQTKCPNGFYSIGEGFCRDIKCEPHVNIPGEYRPGSGGTFGTAGTQEAGRTVYAEPDEGAEKALKENGLKCERGAPQWGDNLLKAN
ncbi:MAG: hypothetical protein FJ077_10410 [Cyanobacteria bacterium K_DeepCast_35m_m2_023]|nr:hypothetical protein [Cyanobacteria bacterium K_DeepCast_35m_m2_023]